MQSLERITLLVIQGRLLIREYVLDNHGSCFYWASPRSLQFVILAILLILEADCDFVRFDHKLVLGLVSF